ncbi:T9SS type A sorting domain-containing protein [Flavisolibacter nicotianae]|uniref:T9SS type A sorting domain-containing protein n=1 Tax=Flavisolibacter nicotianae TaxID=2364882 RepID=UPI000EB1D97C|nr:T9SS type A sorting domain-containing protein [Flavisolibacter nicotianae]
MKNGVLMRAWALLFFLFLNSSFLFAQGTGIIVRTAGLPASQTVLDPIAPLGYTSKTTAGFAGDDVGNSKLPFKPLPSFSNEPFGDLRRGPNHLYSDFVPDANGSGVYVHFDGTYFLFRMRLGSIVPGAKGYSILIDADGKFGATGPNADPTYQAATTGTNGNPGFEIEVDLFTQNTTSAGVVIYDVDGPSGPVQKKTYTNWLDYSQVSIAGTNDNGDPDFFLDFYIPLSDLTTYFGVTASTPLRMNATTVMAPQASIGGPKSDLYGLADSGYKDVNAEWEAYMNAQPSFTPTSLNNTSTSVVGAMCTAPPMLNTPITTGATSVSGTWTMSSLPNALGTATIKIYIDGVYSGQSAPATSGSTWTVTGLSPLAANKVITAKAYNATESECLSSNSVTVTSCNKLTKPATPTLSCATFQKGLTGTNRGSTNSALWVVHVDNLSTNDLRNSTSDQTNAYFSNMSGANWDFSSGCTTGSQMTAGSYKIYYTDNTGCNSEPLFICVSPGKAGSNVAGTLGTPTITSPAGSVFTTAVNAIAGTTQATTNGTLMTLYVDNFPTLTTTATAAGAFSFSNLKLLQGQSLYITSEYNTGTQTTSYCSAKTSAYTVTCFTAVPGINTDATGQLVAGAPITGTSGEPSGTTIKVYTAAGTLVATTTVSGTGTWTTGSYTAVAGTSYYANAANGTCGVSGNTANVSTPSTVTSTSRCGTIDGGLTSSSTTVSGTIVGSAGSPIAAGTKVNVYQDGMNIGTYVFPLSSTSASAIWSIAILSHTLYASGVVTIGIQEAGTAGEVICSASATVTCAGPLNPSYTQQSSNGTSGSGATVPKGGTMTYTITNLSPNTFYSVADATSGQSYASGVWTSNATTASNTISITTNPLTTSGTYNGMIKATSVTSTDMCTTMAALSSFTVLPVTLTEFRGEHTGRANVLRWKATGESKTVRYDVERSTDGTLFSVIGSVAANGTGAYVFNDNKLSAPANYYRLRLVEGDGRVALSKTILLQENGASLVLGAVRPNPFVADLAVSFSTASPQIMTLTLVDATGRNVVQKQVKTVQGTNDVRLDGLAHLPKGMYVLKLQCDDVLFQEKLLKAQ